MMKIFFLLLLLLQTVLLCGGVNLCRNNFHISLSGWKGTSYWGGKISHENVNGKRYMKVVSTSHDGRVYARVYNRYVSRTQFKEGLTIKLTLRAKGTGKMTLGLLAYGGYVNNPVDFVPAEPVTLTPEFKDHTVIITAPQSYASMRPYVELHGQAELLAESFDMASVPDRSVVIHDGKMQIIGENEQPGAAVFSTNQPNREFTAGIWKDFEHTVVKVKSDAAGKVSVPMPTGFVNSAAVHVYASGVTGSAFAVREASSACRHSDAIAAKIKLPHPVRMLVIGDSLSDFYRGYNYVDRLDSWLNKYNPGLFSVRNAGVGGDYLARVQERLVGMMPGVDSTYRQEMYNDLFKEKYDIILIELGPNDTRSNRSENYSKPLTSPEQQRRILTYIINFIRRNSDARIVVLAPSPSAPEASLKVAANIPAGQEFVLFGKPEFIDAFDAVNREVCKQMDVDYVDILTVMRRAPDRNSLYVKDRVHLSAKGGRVITDVIMEYLAEKYRR